MLLGTPGPVWVGFFSTFPAWPTRRTGPFLGAPRKPAGFRSTPGRPSGSPHPQRHVRSVSHRGGLELKASKRYFLMADAALVLRTPAPSLPLSAHLPHRVLGPGHHLRGSQGQCLEAWSGRLGVDLPPPTSPPASRLPSQAHMGEGGSHSCFPLRTHPSPPSLGLSSPTPEPSVQI